MIKARLWSTGLINQLMSLELIIGISALLKQPVYLYNMWDQFDPIGVSSPIYHRNSNRYSEIIDNDKLTRRLSDILNWDQSNWVLEDKNYDFYSSSTTVSLFNKYVNCIPDDHTNEKEFQGFFTELTLNTSNNYNFIDTLGFYSRFFFNRSNAVDDALSKITWKEPYIKLAADIASQLGNFVSAHLRDTDNFGTFKVHDIDFIKGIDDILTIGYPVFLATDNVERPVVREHKKKYTLIDDIIRFDWADRFKQLPYHDETVFALITNLVLGHSVECIGTPGSTFTAYIHRQINDKRNHNWKFFTGTVAEQQNPLNEVKKEGSRIFTWESYPTQPTWWREWPESKINIPCNNINY